MTRFQRWHRRMAYYMFRKVVADIAAFFIIGLLWFWVPSVLVWAFDFNALWFGALWNTWISPYLPSYLQLAGDAISKAHETVLAFLQLGSRWQAGDFDSTMRLEAAARILLIGEAWILKIQISLLLRFLYWRIWKNRHELFADPDNEPPHP